MIDDIISSIPGEIPDSTLMFFDHHGVHWAGTSLLINVLVPLRPFNPMDPPTARDN
jgi:hypothetical protein